MAVTNILQKIPKIVYGLLVIWFVLGIYIVIKYKTPIAQTTTVPDNLPTMTVQELAQFDGSDLTKPVYLGMEGFVYDISNGREEYYNINKPYHFLAGVDATVELRIAGGGIIAKKYPIIAKLVN